MSTPSRWWERIASGVVSFADKDIFGPAVGVAGSLVFALAGLYQQRIAAAHFLWRPGRQPEWIATGFWACVLLLFFAGWAKAIADGRARRGLLNETSRIRNSVETLPDRAFRDAYLSAAVESAWILNNLAPRQLRVEVGEGDLKVLIRVQLQALVELATSYGGVAARTTYAANVMTFVPALSAAPWFSPEQDALLRFIPKSFNREHLAGLLLLDPELSVSSASQGEPDPAMRAFALPVPRQAEDSRGRLLVLPGAPLAYVTGEAEGYSDTETLGDWFRKRASFSDETVEQVLEYFGSERGKQSRSFMSIPLDYLDRRVGVLNLHADVPFLLGPERGDDRLATNGERQEIFRALTTPFVREVAALVAHLGSAWGVVRSPEEPS